MATPDDLSQFLAALAAHWRALLLGGVPVAAWLLWDGWRRKSPSFGFLISVFLAVGLFAASLQAWREESDARRRTEQIITSKRDAHVVNQLQKYYSQASTYYREAVAGLRASDADFDPLQKEMFEWSGGMSDWVMQNMGVAAFNRLAQTSDYPLPYSGISEARSEAFLKIANLQDNLRHLVENPSWDKQPAAR
jgi:hypothetical protein